MLVAPSTCQLGTKSRHLGAQLGHLLFELFLARRRLWVRRHCTRLGRTTPLACCVSDTLATPPSAVTCAFPDITLARRPTMRTSRRSLRSHGHRHTSAAWSHARVAR